MKSEISQLKVKKLEQKDVLRKIEDISIAKDREIMKCGNLNQKIEECKVEEQEETDNLLQEVNYITKKHDDIDKNLRDLEYKVKKQER